MPSPEMRPVSASDLFLGLQFCRANALSLTRLQLALKSGDRQCALEAMDRLHALDAEIERLVQRLPSPENDDPEREVIDRHLSDQKLAIAFEKLALVSEISGPNMVSPPTALPPGEDPPPASLAWPIVPEPEPARWSAVPVRAALGFLLALMTMAAMAAVAMVMTAL
jgi:hypothetical protein